MLKHSYVSIELHQKNAREGHDFWPCLREVRRVPAHYQRALPWQVIKYHQCLILGASARTLTVGIIERKDEQWLASLQTLIGTTIFPVLIEPERMRLLIARIERYQRFRQRYSRACYVLQLPSQMRQLFLLRESRTCSGSSLSGKDDRERQ